MVCGCVSECMISMLFAVITATSFLHNTSTTVIQDCVTQWSYFLMAYANGLEVPWEMGSFDPSQSWEHRRYLLNIC